MKEENYLEGNDLKHAVLEFWSDINQKHDNNLTHVWNEKVK